MSLGTVEETGGARATGLLARFQGVRRVTEELAWPLSAEDQQIQSMPDASPTKWHLGHTTWFFETLVLQPFAPGYRVFDPRFAFLFNSYYEALGPRHERPRRGLLSRPSLDEVHRYRRAVTEELGSRLADDRLPGAALDVVEIGIQHEQQHQELLLTDIKHALGTQPLRPAYRAAAVMTPAAASHPLAWHHRDGGVIEIGHDGAGFAYDNEQPRHRELLGPFALASRLVTCGEYLTFIEDGGYRRAGLWLSDGWRAVQQHGWEAPLYWDGRAGGAWTIYTLSGTRPVDASEPVVHLSFFEADAFARWAGARLPTEAEWEHAASKLPVSGNLLETGNWHVAPAPGPDGALQQLWGDAWEWTASAYAPYPGFRPWPGAIGEYNAKFMCNQMVLRGGSCFTPSSHVRATYRNFFPPEARWQATGIRLARDSHD